MAYLTELAAQCCRALSMGGCMRVLIVLVYVCMHVCMYVCNVCMHVCVYIIGVGYIKLS